MKIAIYEPIHLECIFPFCELFNFRGDQVSFCTSDTFKYDLQAVLAKQYSDFEFTYVNPTESRLIFWRKIHSFFNSSAFDLIILNSIDYRHLMVYGALRKKNSCIVINIHDVNNFFNSGYSFHPKKIFRTLGKKLIAKKAKAFIVHAKPMKDYIISKKYTTKPIFSLPPVITKAIYPALKSRPFIITIPGSIDKNRRDYTIALDMFTKLSAKFPGELKLVFAGRPVGVYGNDIIETARSLKQRGLSISFYEQEIPEDVFRKIMHETSLLWSPLCINTSVHDNIGETYGITKMSGNIYDAVRYGKPLMLPNELNRPEEVRQSCISYSNMTDAEQKLENIIKDKKAYEAIAVNAFKNAQKFSLVNVLSILEELLQQLGLAKRNAKVQHEHLPKK